MPHKSFTHTKMTTWDNQFHVIHAQFMQVKIDTSLETSDAEKAEIAQLNRNLSKGPFIPLKERPTPGQAAALFHLCKEQEFAFRVLADTLEKQVSHGCQVIRVMNL